MPALPMARFDLHPNPFAPERVHTPLVLDVQNDHLGPLATRVVIPLRTAKAMATPARGLNPVFEIDGRTLVLDTASLAPVPTNLLKRPAPLPASCRDEVLDALDTLFGAY
ncbi:MAG: CcdB family protein [Rubrivivax sp.]|nr:CcdB family protein [Rubrivivax sp.]